MGALKIVEACRRTSGGDLTGRFPIGAVDRSAQGARGRDFGSAVGADSQASRVAKDAGDGFTVGAPCECKIGAFVPET